MKATKIPPSEQYTITCYPKFSDTGLKFRAPYVVGDFPGYPVYDDINSEEAFLCMTDKGLDILKSDEPYDLNHFEQEFALPRLLFNAFYYAEGEKDDEDGGYYIPFVKVNKEVGVFLSGFMKLVRPLSDIKYSQNEEDIKPIDKHEEAMLEAFKKNPTGIYYITNLINSYRLNKEGDISLY